MKRYDCLKAIAPHFGEELVVTNIGAVRHEWQALRPHPGNYHLQNLGLTSSMALGLALALPHRKVVAFDGDGSLLLNLGSLATMANQHPKNLIHIVFDNECYESSRGAPTATAGQADLAAVARGCGFANVITAKTLAEFERGILARFEEQRSLLHSGEGRGGSRRRSGGCFRLPGKQIPVRALHREKRELENPHLNTVARQRPANQVRMTTICGRT